MIEGMMKDPYILYIQTFGEVQSGTKIEDKDYRRGSVQFDERGTLAVALAADGKKEYHLTHKIQF